MRLRILLATLMAGTMITPALAQENRDRQRGERMERGDISRPMGEYRATREQSRPQQVPQPRFEPQIQQRQAPPVMAAPVAPSAENRGWRGDWQRRVNDANNARAQTPPVVQQSTTDGNRGWRGNNDGRVNGGAGRPPLVVGNIFGNNGGPRGDRDRDGRPNWRDRDRDGDGIANNRDWDRNNNGRIDGRWDRNRNGVVDRRWDQNRDGVRDNRDWNNNDRRWNNNQNWGSQNWNGNHRWNREWRNDRRYDWQRYRYSNRDLFRQPRYYSPYGNNYGYQRFGIGIYLDSVFFGSRYRISDPWRYRLPDAQWPYEWVRYHDDVLLVDTRTGYVVDVIHEFFW
jgi:Nickel/cobalt transporter regulator